MPLAEVTFYNVVLWVHIVAFLIAFGPTYGYGLFMAAAAKAVMCGFGVMGYSLAIDGLAQLLAQQPAG